jgi:sugar O-acyltransferase (sialic acid O-acetyltransferase NeuD family)
MRTEPVIVVGAGGHGSVVVDALLRAGHPPAGIMVRDDRAPHGGGIFLGCELVAPALPADRWNGRLHVAVGHGAARRALLERSGVPRGRWLTVVHPMASLAVSASVGPGAFIAAMAVVGPRARVGDAAIVNHGAIVDHDCVVGDDAHVAPGASLGGGASVGRGALVGAGARVLPGVRVGDGAVVGAGAVVLSDIDGPGTWVGVPARRKR